MERVNNEPNEGNTSEHAPKDCELVETMYTPSEIALKTLNQLGKFNPSPPDDRFEGLPVLGPYLYNLSTYVG